MFPLSSSVTDYYIFFIFLSLLEMQFKLPAKLGDSPFCGQFSTYSFGDWAKIPSLKNNAFRFCIRIRKEHVKKKRVKRHLIKKKKKENKGNLLKCLGVKELVSNLKQYWKPPKEKKIRKFQLKTHSLLF